MRMEEPLFRRWGFMALVHALDGEDKVKGCGHRRAQSVEGGEREEALLWWMLGRTDGLVTWGSWKCVFLNLFISEGMDSP